MWLLLALACTKAPTSPEAPSAGEGEGSSIPEPKAPAPPPALPGATDPRCAALLEQARSLVASGSCASDADCALLSWYEVGAGGACMPIFQCTSPVVAAEREAITARALEIAAAWPGCEPCVTAMCMDPSRLSAGCEAGSCVLR